MNANDQSDAYQPPIGIAASACFICLILVFRVAQPAILQLHFWWAELLGYAIFPLIVTFSILYRSPWHREWGKVARIGSMLLSAGAIFCCVSIIGLGVITALFVVVNRFTAIHY
jgi:hypothetical protein